MIPREVSNTILPYTCCIILKESLEGEIPDQNVLGGVLVDLGMGGFCQASQGVFV